MKLKQRIASALTGNYVYNAAKVLHSSPSYSVLITDISAEYLEQLLQQMMLVVTLKMKLPNKGQRILPVMVMLSSTVMN